VPVVHCGRFSALFRINPANISACDMYYPCVTSGFINSYGLTVTTIDSSIGSTDYYNFQQFIEGFNVADLGWGTASAQTITVSFWVRSSVTGTFAGSVCNSALNRSYVFTYTISAANTFEYKTVTIPGDTSGTWLTNNGRGIILGFDLGNGSSYQAAAGSWVSSYAIGTSSSVKLISTLNATFQITGVQLERNTTATPFEWIPYTTELQLCQRYYYRVTPGFVGGRFGTGQVYSSTAAIVLTSFPVSMRTAPAAIEQNGTASHYAVLNSRGSGVTCTAVPSFNQSTTILSETVFTVASGLTAGNSTVGLVLNSNAYLGWSAEL